MTRDDFKAPDRSRRAFSLHAMKCFLVAGERLSFTKAAEELHLTQSAVSRQVQILEDQLGFTLFRRLTRRLELTPRGRVLLDALRAGFAEIERGVRQAAAHTDRPGITVSMPPTFSMRWGTMCIVEFQKRHPEVDISLRIDGNGTLFHEGQSDIGIEFIPEDLCRKDAALLFHEVLVPVCTPLHAEARAGLGVEDFLRASTLLHVQQGSDRYGDWRDWLARRGLGAMAIERGMVFETAEMALSAAKQGAGICMADCAYIREDLEIGTLATPFPTPIRSGRGYFIQARNLAEERLTEAFIAFMTEMCAPLRAASA